jgi:hypothetical protein
MSEMRELVRDDIIDERETHCVQAASPLQAIAISRPR